MGKFLILAIIVAVIASAYIIIDDDGNSDYTLLDSSENIVPGLTIEEEENYAGYGYYYGYTVVTAVNGNDVYYDHENHLHYSEMGVLEYQSNSFEPNGFYINFDYTSGNIPEGVTVDKVYDMYILNGEIITESEGMYIDIVFNYLVIEYDGKNVQSVYGSFDSKMDDKNGEGYIWEEVTLVTIADVITGIGDRSTKASFVTGLDQFYPEAIVEFDLDKYKGCDVKQSAGRFGNVNVDVYTINGTVEGVELIDFKYCVYDGYIIKAMGKQLFDPLEDSVPINHTIRIAVIPVPEPEPIGYELLDSTDYIVPGMTLEFDWLFGENSAAYHETLVVKSVEDGTVTYNTQIVEEYIDTGIKFYEWFDFEPNAYYINFDYTSGSVPETVTVEKEGDVYTLNGKFSIDDEGYNVTTEFQDLVIKYVDGKVAEVDGKVAIDKKGIDTDDRVLETAELVTMDRYLTGTGDLFSGYTGTAPVTSFYLIVCDIFSEDQYEGCEIVESKDVYGGVEVTVYTINGQAENGKFYKDYKAVVYDCYEIADFGLVGSPLMVFPDQFDNKMSIYINN